MLTRWKSFRPYPFQMPYPDIARQEYKEIQRGFFQNLKTSDIRFLEMDKPDSKGLVHGVLYVNDTPYLDCIMHEGKVGSSRVFKSFAECLFSNDWVMNEDSLHFDEKFFSWVEKFGIRREEFREILPGDIETFGTYTTPLTPAELAEKIVQLAKKSYETGLVDEAYSCPIREVDFLIEWCCRAKSAEEAFTVFEFFKRFTQEKMGGKDFELTVNGKRLRISVLVPHCTETREDFIMVSDASDLYCVPIVLCFYRAGNARIWTNGITNLYPDDPTIFELGVYAENRVIPLEYLLDAISKRELFFTKEYREGRAEELHILRDGIECMFNPEELIQAALKALPWLQKRPCYDEKGFVTDLAAFQRLQQVGGVQ